MSTIPNVSSIYRQLTSIYTNINLSPNYLSQNNYHLSQKPNTNKTCFQDMYSYKQKRHDQLMSRLQNSHLQHQQLIREIYQKNQNQLPSNGNHYQYRSSNHYHQPSYNHYPHNNYNSFVMPKIRYRHLEDEQNKHKKNTIQPNTQQQNNQKQPQITILYKETQQLQKQFYEDDKQKQNQSTHPTKPIQINAIAVQTSNPSSIIPQHPKTLNSFHRQNQSNNYEQKISHYYELCRKNINKNQQQQQKAKQNRFTRTSSNNNKAMKLDQAIKLLSYD